MNHARRIGGSDLDRGVGLTGRGATDQEGHIEPLARHFLRHMDHLIERGRNKPAQADDVGFVLTSCSENFFAGHHHAKIDDLIVVTAKDDPDNVFSDVVHIALHGRKQDLPLRLEIAGPLFLFFHVWHEIGHRLLHDASALHDLRQEHLA